MAEKQVHKKLQEELKEETFSIAHFIFNLRFKTTLFISKTNRSLKMKFLT